MTEKREKSWLFFDDQCPVCRAFARWVSPRMARCGIQVEPLQSPWVGREFGLTREDLLSEMRLWRPGRGMTGGGDALLDVIECFPWLRILAKIGRLPGVHWLICHLYAWFAAHRPCFGGACTNRPRPARRAWIGLAPVILAFLFLPAPPWVFMWVLAFAIWLGIKLAVYSVTPRGLFEGGMEYLAWPGTDALTFFSGRKSRISGTPAWAGIVAGLALLVPAVYLPADRSILRGMFIFGGVIGILHFGILEAFCEGLRRRGWNAASLMDAPWRSVSLAEFWGRRWNTGFSLAARHYLFVPLARRLGVGWAALVVFLASGLVHDLVVSVPARGGWGRPTLYFLIQAVGVALERSALGQRIGLRGRGAGRAYVYFVVLAPASLLLHPPFCENILIPMFRALGGHL